MATPTIFRVPENAAVPFTFSATAGQSVDGLTVTIKAVHPTTGTAYTLGTGTGAAAGTNFSVTCDFSGLPATGVRYELWGAADIAGSNPVVVVPNDNTSQKVYIDYYEVPIF